MNAEQQQNIQRCLKRLQIFQSTVSNLLKLAAERQEIGPPPVAAVDVGSISRSMEALYRTLAEKKSVTLQVRVKSRLGSGTHIACTLPIRRQSAQDSTF
ncbi:MAG: hypothetical protein M0036_08160 [Desulfobacteraceae bacterium]|nr:hypothetical protein [Desulfobacteraceae bacterium]